MSQTQNHHRINYIEFAATEVEAAKRFYSSVFGWNFIDYGPDYASFDASAAGIAGGFYKTEPHEPQAQESSVRPVPLVVLYSADLPATEAAIVAADGEIVVPTFEFPGGRRFHFADGVGNVLAVWSK